MTSSTRRPFRFGIQLGLAGSGAEWHAAAARTEAAGYDILLIPDHFGSQLSPFPALAAAAAATTTLRVGTLVACNDFRHPLVLAKDAATVDLLSDGRFELGIGAGWHMSDYAETGIRFDEPGVRVARLKESIELVRRAWSGDTFSFDGTHYTAREYCGGPLPVQRPGPPLLIGSGAPKLLNFAARTADIVQFAPRPVRDGSGLIWSNIAADEVARKAEWVRMAAPERLDSLEISCNVIEVEITDDVEGAVARLAGRLNCEPDVLRDSPHVWIGPVDAIVDRLRRWRERLGISYYAILGDLELLEAGAPIVAALAGT